MAAVLLAAVTTGYGRVDTTAGAHMVNHGRVNAVNERENTILEKIQQGDQPGALVPGQVEDFKRRYNEIQSQKTQAMAQRHGHMSKSEMKDLKKKEGQLELEIEAAEGKK